MADRTSNRRGSLVVVLGVAGGLVLLGALVAAFAPYGAWPSASQSYCGALLNPPASADAGPWCDSYRNSRWLLTLLLVLVGGAAVAVAVKLRQAERSRIKV